MYYSYPCPVCGKLFYTFSKYRQAASQTLYYGIEKHMKDYREEQRDYVLDHPDKMYQDINTIDYNMTQSSSAPQGGYEIE